VWAAVADDVPKVAGGRSPPGGAPPAAASFGTSTAYDGGSSTAPGFLKYFERVHPASISGVGVGRTSSFESSATSRRRCPSGSLYHYLLIVFAGMRGTMGDDGARSHPRLHIRSLSR